MPIRETSAPIEDVQDGCHDSLLMSNLTDQSEINQTPPLSYPTFYLFTQSPSYAAKHQHSVQKELHQESSVHVHPPAQQQSPMNQQQPPA